MLAAEDHTGVISMLGGLVLVVMCGIGISLIADNSLGPANSRAEVERSIAADDERVSKLNAEINSARNVWQEDHEPLLGQADQMRKAKSVSDRQDALLADLRNRHSELERSLKQTDAEFENYRKRFRNQARKDSVGEEYENLALNDGRNYRMVVIRGVDDAGLRIHHQGGSARIAFSDLSESWQERFQWHPDELATVSQKKSEETRRLTTEEPGADRNPPPILEPTRRLEPYRRTQTFRAGKPDPERIARARIRFSTTRKAYLEARSQAATARSKSNSSQKSVPGSLDTWAERADQLNRMSTRLHADHLRARDELRELSPGDALLGPGSQLRH